MPLVDGTWKLSGDCAAWAGFNMHWIPVSSRSSTMPLLIQINLTSPAWLVPYACTSMTYDDMLGAGDRTNARYLEAESNLKEIFNFRTWEDDSQVLEYCGVKLHRKDFAWGLEQEDFLRKVKPITLHKGRSPENEMNDHDRSQLRGLLGSQQCNLHLSYNALRA